MSEQPSKSAARRQARARDEGAPLAPEPTPGAEAEREVRAVHTYAAPGPSLEDVQAGIARGGVVGSSLPVGDDQVNVEPDALRGAAPNAVLTPTVAPSGAPAGSTWADATVDQQPSKYNENEPGPRLAYVVVWPSAAVAVDPAKVQTRTVGDGEEKRTERFLPVRSQFGSRDALVEGEQITLRRGDVLPEEASEGQGVLLASLGGATAVSIPPEAQPEND